MLAYQITESDLAKSYSPVREKGNLLENMHTGGLQTATGSTSKLSSIPKKDQNTDGHSPSSRSNDKSQSPDRQSQELPSKRNPYAFNDDLSYNLITGKNFIKENRKLQSKQAPIKEIHLFWRVLTNENVEK